MYPFLGTILCFALGAQLPPPPHIFKFFNNFSPSKFLVRVVCVYGSYFCRGGPEGRGKGVSRDPAGRKPPEEGKRKKKNKKKKEGGGGGG